MFANKWKTLKRLFYSIINVWSVRWQSQRLRKRGQGFKPEFKFDNMAGTRGREKLQKINEEKNYFQRSATCESFLQQSSIIYHSDMNQMRVIFHFRCNSLIKPICLQEPTTTFMFYYFFAIQTKVDSMAGAKAIRNQYFFYKRLLAGEI